MRQLNQRQKAQAANASFDLHTLGWEAFQNLCSHVAQEVLAQSVTVYSPSNDVGQDGAFTGIWKKSRNEIYDGRFVLQCKFTSQRESHLALSHLKDELAKARRLAKAGLADTYLLITNAKLSGKADVSIRQAFSKIPGINHFDVFGSEWLTQQIIKSKRLRAHVPRIYGLGDLTQILDERIYRQTEEILYTWRDNLAKFVPTEAHRKSVKALLDDGFVMLLGEPMAGKSTIAASLALAAADAGCSPVFLNRAQDFTAHWNPDEPHQFFWVDDVFGQTQYSASSTEGWNQIFPTLAAAIRKGTKVLFTSRTYIYNYALSFLKVSAFPLLKSKRVIIEVEKLTDKEKERILYNHMRLGNQPSEFRSQIKFLLSALARNPKFFPEIARRLGNTFFTSGLKLNSEALQNFVEKPNQFLEEIVSELDKTTFSALALLFMRAGRVSIPLCLDEVENKALTLLNPNLSGLRDCFISLEGSLVSVASENGSKFWKFRHPSIRDAMATNVSSQHDLVDIYLAGAKPEEILGEVVCGNVMLEGAKVHVPPHRYDQLLQKLRGLDVRDWRVDYSFVSFLNRRCPIDFVTRWFTLNREQFYKTFDECIHQPGFDEILAKLNGAGVLPEDYRRKYVDDVTDTALDNADCSFLSEEVRGLVSEAEVSTILQRIKDELLPKLEEEILAHEDCFDPAEDDPRDHFSDWKMNLQAFEDLHDDEDIIGAFQQALEIIEDGINRLHEQQEEYDKEERRKKNEAEAAKREEEDLDEGEWARFMNIDEHKARPPAPKAVAAFTFPTPPRSIFDDVDA